MIRKSSAEKDKNWNYYTFNDKSLSENSML